MPGKPSVFDVHTNVWLSNVASQWLIADREFVCGQVFPIVPVQKLTDNVLRYDRRDWFSIHGARPRAPATEPQAVGYGLLDPGTYYAREYASAKVVPDELRANADNPMNVDLDATRLVTQLLKLKREYIFAQNAFVPAVWTTNFAGIAGASNYGAFQLRFWSDWVTPSTPIQDISWLKIYMKLLTGFQPNTLVLSKAGWYALKHHPQLIARYIMTQAVPVLTTQMVANVLELDKIVVAEAVGNYGPEQGQWDGRFIFGNHALLCYTTPTPSLLNPSAGYTFSYTAAGHQGFTVQIENVRLANNVKADRIDGNFYMDVRVVEPDLGIFISNIVAPGFAPAQVIANVV